MMWGAGRNSSPWKSPFSKWMTRLPVSRSSASALRIDAHCLGRTKWEVRLESRRGFVAVVAMFVVSPWMGGELPGVRTSCPTGVGGSCAARAEQRLGGGGADPQRGGCVGARLVGAEAAGEAGGGGHHQLRQLLHPLRRDPGDGPADAE